MKDEHDNKVVPFPARLLTGALVLIGVMLVAMAWSGVDSYRNIATAHLRDLRIVELGGTLVHLDEVLTMSARMAAATGDSDWERRYRQFEPQLDAAIKEAMELTAHSDGARATAQTDAANLKLVEMENHGFTLIRAGEAGRARAVLFSDAYEAQKRIYAEGMGKLILQLKEQLTAHQRKKQREALLAIMAVAFGIALVFLTLAVLRRLNYWRTMQSASLDGLTRAEEALRKLNDGLEKRVEDRTRALRLEIQERKDVEAALRGSDEKFRQLAENVTDVFWMRSPDMREVHYVSPAYERTWGRSTESLYSNPHQWADAIVPEDRERVLAVFATLAGTAARISVEYRIARPDGEVRWVHVRGFQVRDAEDKLVRVTGIVTDITDRKKAEEAMRESEERFSGAFEHAPIGVALVSPDGRWLKVNRALCNLVGYSEAGLLARTFQDITHPEDLEVDLENVRQMIAGEIRCYQMEKRYVHARGHFVTVLLNVSLVRDGRGHPRYFISQIQDISERKLSEAALEQTHKELREASRKAGMAEVATGVLHNVGNVLNSVNVSATLISYQVRKSKSASLGKVAALLREHEADLGAFITTDPNGKALPAYLGKLADHLGREQEIILAELGQLAENIEHIKGIVVMQQSYAKVSGLAEIVNVADLVEDALRLNAEALRRHGVRVVREFQDSPPISVEKHKVLQILVNLVLNAKRACDDFDRADKQLTVLVANSEGRMNISVRDNGVGIPAENLTRIFSHGFTTRKDGHGFGLHSGALAARELGGSLSVQSGGPGQGAMFTLVLPLEPLKNNYGDTKHF